MFILKSANAQRTVRARALHAFVALPVITLVALMTARAQTDEKILAVVDGRAITQKEVDDSILAQLLPLRQQIFELRRKALDVLVVRALLESEAKRRGVSAEALRRQLTEGRVEVSPEEVEKVYAENASVLAGMGPDEARERIRLDLESQSRMRLYREAVAKLKERAEVDILLEEVRLPVAPGGGAFSLGPEAAAVTIVEFSDFQCPYCRGVQPALKQLMREYGGVRLVFKNLPLSDIHPQAMPSALAAFCAGEQEAFWQYHDALFASDDLSPEGLERAARSVGLNLSQFKSCLGSEKARSAVLADVREARRLGVNGTPAFIINGKLVGGALSLDDLRRLIDRELKSVANAPTSR